MGGGIFAAELAQRGLLLRFEGVETRHFGIDGGFLCAQFGLLLHKPGNHAFVGLVDVAGVLQIALFLAGLGVFQKQHHGVGLAVFIMAAQKARHLRFGAGHFGFQTA